MRRPASASSIHFGHYIAGIFNPEILIINATMANISLWTGFAYERWKKGINVMIEKTNGDFNVEKLHIILLFEADFNANNKWIDQAVMFQAECTHLLANEQYGSCKHKTAIHQCLNKNLFYNLVRFKRQPVDLCLNDAKSCYDRITLLAMAICLSQFRGLQPMVNSMITTLHEMQQHIRMTFRDSYQSASHKTWKAPIAGVGQGNGVGPHIWAAVSSPLLDLMQQDGFYANMMVAISLQQKQLVSFAFMDDMDLCMFGPHVNTLNVQLAMENSMDHWEGLLHATSGTLISSKCFWYFIDFQFINNTWKYVTKHQEPKEIQIKDEHQHRVAIPCLELHEARHTLGVHLAMDCNWDMEYNYLLLVTLDWKV